MGRPPPSTEVAARYCEARRVAPPQFPRRWRRGLRISFAPATSAETKVAAHGALNAIRLYRAMHLVGLLSSLGATWFRQLTRPNGDRGKTSPCYPCIRRKGYLTHDVQGRRDCRLSASRGGPYRGHRDPHHKRPGQNLFGP